MGRLPSSADSLPNDEGQSKQKLSEFGQQILKVFLIKPKLWHVSRFVESKKYQASLEEWQTHYRQMNRTFENREDAVSIAMKKSRNPFAGARVCRLVTGLLLLLLPALGTGCGSFVARRMAQAPNTYPSWLAPSAPVLVSFNDSLLTNSPARFADVGPPPARLRYRVVEPADYHLKVISTNWIARGGVRYKFTFRAGTPIQTNAWTATPRGTVVLLHGYGLAEFSMI
jgi:hypothetical protein